MRSAARSAIMLLPLFVCACGHKTSPPQVQSMAPPIEDAPPPKSDTATAEKLQGPDVKTFPAPPPPTVVVKPQEPPKNPKRKKSTPKPAPSAPSAPAPSQTAQVASEAQQPAVSAIGNLTTGEPDAQKKQAQDAIADVEKTLGSIGRKLNDAEEKTAAQIHEYLKQARAALDTNDVDAANTLAKKAKFLLTELTE